MMYRVELVYDSDCPNVGQTRAALLQACAQAGVSASWVEWDRKAPESPAYVREYGSPTILVNGKDVADAEPGEEVDCCRLYSDGENGLHRTPSVEQIAAALTKCESATLIVGGRGLLTVAPGIGTSLLPVLTCPACWPAYAGLLGSIGLGFLVNTTSLLLVTALLLGLALVSLGYRATSRRGYGPLGAGIGAVSLILVSKFALSSNALLYLGLASLMGASLWNSWPHKAVAIGSCATCAPQELKGVEQPSNKGG